MRTDDYIKNMTRRMLAEEGWVRDARIEPPIGSSMGTRRPGLPTLTADRTAGGFMRRAELPDVDLQLAPLPTYSEMEALIRNAKFRAPTPVITIGPDCEPRVLVDV